MPKYKMIKFYKRRHEQVFASPEAATAHLEAARLNNKAECYSELWEMANDQDGEQVGVYDSDGNELVLKDPVGAIRKARARLVKR